MRVRSLRRGARLRYPGAPPVVLAHRGGPAYGGNRDIENSTAAFAAAVALGYTHLETDVHVTADGVLLALHDERVDRVAGVAGVVAEAPYDELRRVRLGGREPIPTMAELFAAFPTAVFNIDLKAAGTPAALWREVKAAGAQQRVCVGSFSPWRLWQFRRLARGAVATTVGPIGTAWLRFAPAWLSRWIHSPGTVYQVPRYRRFLGRDVEIVTRDFLAAAHRIGRQVHVWTINDPAEMAELLDLGVEGLVSDAIDVAAKVLERRGGWPPPVPRASRPAAVSAAPPRRRSVRRPG